MKLANKNLYHLFKDAGLDLAALTLRRQAEIILVYVFWIHLFMNAWQMSVYCLEGITNFFQAIMLLVGFVGNKGTC